MMTAEPTDTLRPCLPWCEDGRGHATEHPEDRSCWSTFSTIDLANNEPGRFSDGSPVKSQLSAYLRRPPENDHTGVWLHLKETATEVRLRVAEAPGLVVVAPEVLAVSEGSATR